MRRSVALALLLLSASPVAAAAAPPRDGVREVFDIRYHPGWNGRHKLDLFLPAADSTGGERRPVVIFLHGGTWMIGDKNFFGIYRGVGRCLAKNGYVGVMINYRLSPLVKHPEHTVDAARAFAWVRKNIAKHGGDPDRIILAGHSAGAHLVSLIAMDDCYLSDPKLDLTNKDRKAIKGIVAVSGVYRIPAPAEYRVMAQRTVDYLVGAADSGKLTAKLNSSLMCVSGTVNPFLLVFGKDGEVHKQASPLTHVRRGLPPFLLLNSEYEVAGLHGMAEEFLQALKKHDVPVEHLVIEDTTHRTVVKKLHSADDQAGKAVLAFVRRHAGTTAAGERKAAVSCE